MKSITKKKNSSNTIHVTHIIHHLVIGGLENGLVNLINSMPEDEFTHSIVCMTRYSDFKDRIKNKSVSLYALNKKEGKDLFAYFRLYKLLKMIKPHILHTRNLGTIDCAVIAKIAGVPYRVHGEHGWGINDLYGNSVKHKYFRKICNIFVNQYIALSDDILRWLVGTININKKKCLQIYNGVNTEKFIFSSDARKYTRSQININDSDVVIGSVGRLNLIKDYTTLIHAFEKIYLSNKYNNVSLKLVIVGGGECYEDLDNLIKSKKLSKNIILLGDRSDISTILSGFDIFTLCSLNEGISNSILEAMSVGLPIVATDVGGNSELITNGETGTLVSAGDIDNLALALRKYLSDSETARQHGINARNYVIEKFSLSVMVEKYTKIYKEAFAKT
jgi:sugar transferase (PEP-CTERM/EpsH1 system associated)